MPLIILNAQNQFMKHLLLMMGIALTVVACSTPEPSTTNTESDTVVTTTTTIDTTMVRTDTTMVTTDTTMRKDSLPL